MKAEEETKKAEEEANKAEEQATASDAERGRHQTGSGGQSNNYYYDYY